GHTDRVFIKRGPASPLCRFHVASEMLLRAQGKFHHALQQLVGGQADEIAQHQLLGVETYYVAQLQRLVARRVYKVAMPAIDYDDVRAASNFERHNSPSARSRV